MTVQLGEGEFRYEEVENWAKLPAGWQFGNVGAVAIDRHDQVYVFSRGGHPMTVFDREGNFLRAWGDGLFPRPHGLHIGPDNTIWCTDDGDHSVRQCTLEGRVLMTIGTPGKPAPYMGGTPFHRCTHTALSPQGEVYVADGYGNARVHKYTPDGRYLMSWGGPGTAPGQFNVVHNICCDADGWVYVADRENHRIQVFDGNGRFETQWNNLHRPCGLFMPAGRCPLCYVAELGPVLEINRDMPNLGPRISILDSTGKLLAQFGELGLGAGRFIAPHGIAVDSRGDIYVGETAYNMWPRVFPKQAAPAVIPSLRKLRRLP